MSVICENCKRSFRTWGLRKSCPYCLHVIGAEPYDYKPPQSLFCPDCGNILSGGGHRHVCPGRQDDSLFSLGAATALNPSNSITAGGFMGAMMSDTQTTPSEAPASETPSTTDYSPSGGDSSSSGSDSSSSGSDYSGS